MDNHHLLTAAVGKTISDAYIDDDGEFWLAFTDGTRIHGHPWGSYADDVGLDLDDESLGPWHGPEVPPGPPPAFDLALRASYWPMVEGMFSTGLQWEALTLEPGKTVTFTTTHTFK